MAAESLPGSPVLWRLMIPGIEPPSTFERVTEATFSSFSGFTFDRAPVTDSFF